MKFKIFARWLASKIDERDITLVVGLSLLGWGLSEIFVPLALIVPGVVLTHLAIQPGKPPADNE